MATPTGPRWEKFKKKIEAKYFPEKSRNKALNRMKEVRNRINKSKGY